MDITIERANASKIRVYPNDLGILEDLYQNFRYEEPTFKPGKWSKWDGVVRMYNKNNYQLSYGMLPILLSMAQERGWTMEVDPAFKDDFTKVEIEELEEWVDTLNLHSGGNKIDPYEYQVQALYEGVRYSRSVLLAATSAGKSLIQYMLVRYYQMCPNPNDLKILLIVPSINLVSQMSGDFKDYSSANGWDAEKMCHLIAEGNTRFSDKPVFISTWQSLKDMPVDYFHQFGFVLVDEVHGASAKSISYILDNCVNAYKRVGLTGTLKDEQLHPLMVQAHFGPIKKIVTARELIRDGRATPTNITIMNLEYPQYAKDDVSQMDHNQEIEWLIEHPYRNKIIESLILSLKGNSLFMFGRVDAHLKVIAQNINARNMGKQVFIISGEVKGKERDEIKAAIERGDDIALLATVGTMSTGISIKKLHNLVFCHPMKSIIKILQSIGRLLRLHESKDIANIYDIVDNLGIKGRNNYALEWAIKRFGYYENEGHPTQAKKIAMK